MAFNAVVYHRVQQARGCPRHRRQSSLDKVDKCRAAEEDQELRKQATARNAELLGRYTGMLIEKHRGLLGGESEQHRWVVLDPPEGTLSVWDRQPREASFTISGSGPSPPPGKHEVPRKVYSLDKLAEVDSNPSFRNIYLHFKGAAVSLVAETDEDFRRWMAAFAAYDVSSPNRGYMLPADVRQLSMAKPEALRGRSSSSLSRSCSPVRDRSMSRGRNKQIHCDFRTAYHQCCMTEPNPEPAPGFHEACNLETYDIGSLEPKAVIPSMGIMEHLKKCPVTPGL